MIALYNKLLTKVRYLNNTKKVLNTHGINSISGFLISKNQVLQILAIP